MQALEQQFLRVIDKTCHPVCNKFTDQEEFDANLPQRASKFSTQGLSAVVGDAF